MSDPFDALRAPVTPVRPDPVFAARLRARLQRALLDPTGGTMTETAPAAAGQAGTPAADIPLHTLTPYIEVADARRAVDWYTEVLGARRRGDPIMMPDGRVGHAELAFGDSVLMLSEEFPEQGLISPKAQTGHSHSVQLQVDDVDGTVRQAVEHGAELTRPPADHPYGRNAVINDPFGHRWMIWSVPAGAAAPAAPAASRHGDVTYITHEVADSQRARDFYAAVLGWSYSPGHIEDGWQVSGTTPMAGLSGGHQHATVVLCYQVDDIHAAVRRVRENGGQASEPSQRPYGLLADCADNQGTRFYLAQ